MTIINFRYRNHVVFNRNILKVNWEKINETPLKRAGLLVRRIERQSIRRDTTRSQRPSKPGRPPKSRAPGHPFRMIFSVPGKTDVIIGHMGFGRGRQTPMEIHEFGQMVTISEIVRPNRRRILDPVERARVRAMYLSGRLRHKPVRRVTRTIKMPERKFAEPALNKAALRLPQLWQNSVAAATRGRVELSSLRLGYSVRN